MCFVQLVQEMEKSSVQILKVFVFDMLSILRGYPGMRTRWRPEFWGQHMLKSKCLEAC